MSSAKSARSRTIVPSHGVARITPWRRGSLATQAVGQVGCSRCSGLPARRNTSAAASVNVMFVFPFRCSAMRPCVRDRLFASGIPALWPESHRALSAPDARRARMAAARTWAFSQRS